MNRRKLNVDEFAVETFDAGLNPVVAARGIVGPASPTVWTTCSPTCDTTVFTTDTQ
ncbi:MAG TPA: hypothetical protein VF092_06365 [Longimicrobium sp.]